MFELNISKTSHVILMVLINAYFCVFRKKKDQEKKKRKKANPQNMTVREVYVSP